MGKLDKFLEKHRTSKINGLYGDNLRGMLDELLKFKEFENVKKINVLDYPTYMASNQSGKPIDIDEDYLGGSHLINVLAMKISTNEVNKFNEEIDVYGFELTPEIYNREQINETIKTHGVWRLPTIVNEKTFEAMESIVVNWSPEAIQTTPQEGEELPLPPTVNEAKLKKRLIRLFTEALERTNTNIPMDKAVIIRCSPRSFV